MKLLADSHERANMEKISLSKLFATYVWLMRVPGNCSKSPIERGHTLVNSHLLNLKSVGLWVTQFSKARPGKQLEYLY